MVAAKVDPRGTKADRANLPASPSADSDSNTDPDEKAPIASNDAGRRRRIAELLCKAMLLTEASDAVTAAEGAAGFNRLEKDSTAITTRDEESDQILQFLSVVREASPAMIRESLGVSRSAVYRTLRRLSREQLVISEGQTRMLVYRLNQAEPPPEILERN
jgi:DNA-binding transcriptional ArsR family regulator